MALEESDETLVRQSVAGDRAAFAALVARHYDAVFRVAWKWSGDRGQAEEIAQNVCVRLPKALEGYQFHAKFSTWLYRVTVNATRDYQRQQQSQQRGREAWESDPNGAALQEEMARVESSDTPDLWQAVRQLPPKQCDAILLVYGEELSHADAAKVMGCAEGTVSSHIHDAKKRLKDLLSEEAKV